MQTRNIKRILSTFLIVAILITMLPISTFAATDVTNSSTANQALGEEKIINILHTNDSHGRVFPDANNKGMIGIDKIAAIDKATLNSILVDAGDTLHGLPIANTTQGLNVIELMNLAGYDVMTPGNHDFNYGSAKLKEYATASTTNFDIISSNVVEKEGQAAFLAATSIQIVDGVKVGFFGLSTTETPVVTNPVNVSSLEFKEYLTSAEKAIQKLKAENVDVIVGLTHVSRQYVKVLAAELKNDVAVLIDGHDHLNTSETVSGVLISSAGQHEENLGKITVKLNSNNAVISKVATLITKEQTANIIADEKVKTRATEMISTVNNLLNQKVGTSEVLLDSSRGDVSNGIVTKGVRNSEMPLGNVVTDAMRTILNADIAITNGGGLRANIGIGDISKGTLNAVLPFGNYVVVKEVTPKQLKAILENGIANAPNPVGSFPHVSGMKFEYNLNAVAGARVTKITIANNVLDLNDSKTIYKLATNDFVSNGGDGYISIKELKTITEGDSLDVIFENYVKSLPNAKITAENAKIESRILAVAKPMHSIAFSDIKNHWSKDNIDFVVEREVFTGIGDNKFGPDQAMTRGMLVTVLGKVAKADTSEKSDFIDVPANKYYSAYIAWAFENGIVNGVGGNKFEPTRAISREELATILNNYIKYMKLKLKVVNTTLKFTDDEKISSWARGAVTSLQTLGLIGGKPGNVYDPKGTTTRAEVSAVLKKYIESSVIQ